MPGPAIRALEPRFVFDGAAAPAAAQAHADAATQSHGDGADAHHAEPADTQKAAPVAAAPGHETASAAGRHEIVVIDKGVADLQTLLAGVPASAEVILIDSARDGFDQLADALRGRSDIDAIHVLSHGSAGDLRLGTGELNATTIQGRYAADLAAIGRALTATGDLLIYGCDFAAGATGARAAALLAEATGADVAASNDATGHADVGGDWDLEVHEGAIESGVVVGEAAQRDWRNLLAAGVDNGRGALLAVSGRTIYSIDIGTGKATAITTAPATVGGINLSTTLNSLAVDQANGLIYYVDSAGSASNRALFAYDFVNNQHILIDSDLADNGLTIGGDGVGGAGAAFARGTLYLAVENINSSNHDQIYQITFSNNGRTVASGSAFGAAITRANEWGDITVDTVNNQLISLTGETYARYNLDTGAQISVSMGNRDDFQAGYDQGGFIYAVGNRITRINPTNGAALDAGKLITTNGSTALGGVADAAAWTPPTSTIGGSVFADSNGNGSRGSGERGLQGITVDLVDDVNGNGTADAGERVLATDTTDTSGAYRFTGVLPGQFVVRVTDTENRLTTSSATTPTSGGVSGSRVGVALNGPDFGYNPTLVIDLDASASGTGYATRYTENGAGVAVVDSDVTITDSLFSSLVSAQARIENGRAGDVLAIAGALPSGIAASYNGATYTLTLSGSASIADYQTALEQIRYSSTSEDPTALTRSVAITVNDSAINSNTARASVAVEAINDAPVNTVPSAQTVNEDTSLVFSAGRGNAITVSDPDAGTASLTTTISVAHGTLTLGTTSGVTVIGNGTGTVRLTGSASAINAALDGTTYRAAANYAGADTLTVVTDDNGNSGQGGALSDRDTVDITVAPINDAPVNGLPASQSVNEDTDLVFSSAGGNALTVSDVDAGGAPLTTTLGVQHGVLILGGTANVTVTGSGTGTVTLTGTVADINAALDGTIYRAAPNYNGADTLTMTTDDNGNTGAGGRLSDTDSLALTVVAVADPPVTTTPSGTQAATEDTPLVFSPSTGNGVTVSDVDGLGLTVTLSSAQGRLTLSQLTGLTFTAGDGVGDTTMTFSGSDIDINAALDGLRFDPSADYNGAAGITLVTRGPTRTADNFTNGGFENPVISGSANAFVPDASVPGWMTDASDGQIEIWKSGFNGVTAYEGSQFAEINANQVAALFQTFDAAAGSKITLDFAHRGRQGVDTMKVLVTDLGADGVLGGGDDRILLDKNYADGRTWGAYHEELAEGASGNRLRFEFRSISAAGGSPSVGNFVDGIRIQQSFESTDTIQIAVAAVADIVPDAVTTNEDTGVTFNVLTGTNGASADSFENPDARVTSVTQPANGSVVFQPDGTMTYTPNADFNGTDSFTYTVTSGGRTETTSVTVDVLPVNDAPVNAVPVGQSVDEDTDLVFSTGNGNAITVSDVDAGSASLTTTLGVQRGTLTLGAASGVTVTGSGTGTVTLVGTAADINAALNGLTYRGNQDYNGADTLTITTDDGGNTGSGGARQDTDMVALSVRPVADPPVNTAPTATQTIDEDTPLVFSAGAGNGISVADPDGGTLTVTLSSAQGRLTLSRVSGLTFQQGDGTGDGAMSFTGTIADINAALEGLRFDPNPDANGPAQIALTTRDPEGTTAASTIVVAITPVADIVPDAIATDEDVPITFDPIAGTNGASPDNFEDAGRAVTAVTQGAHGRVTIGGDGRLTYTPDADYNGPDSFTYTVTSGGTTETATVTVTVRPVNDAPRAGVLPSIGALDGDRIPGTDLGRFFTDVEGDRLSFSAGNLPPGLTIDPATGIVSGTIDRSASRGGTNGDYAVTVTADDGNGGLTSRAFTWRVVNPAPIARNDGAVVDAATPLTGSVLADNGNGPDSDPDGDRLAVSAVNGAGADVGRTVAGSAGGRFIVLADGSYRFDPVGDFADLAAGETRTTRITYTISDGDGGTAQATLIVTVAGRATPPATLAPGDRAAADGQTVTLPLGGLFPNPGGTPLRYAATGLPPGLAIDPATGTISGTVDHAASGTAGLADYRVTITATDPAGTATSQGFTFRVTNPAPLARDDTATTAEDSPVTVDVLANDTDPDGDAVTIVTTGDAAPSAGHGRVAVVDGRLVYTPDPDFHGTDTITYAIVDENGGISTATVTVTVAPVDDAPSAGTLPDQYGRDGAPVRYDVSTRFRDADTDPSVVQGPSGDSLRFSATGLPPGLAIDPATGLISGTLPSDASAVSSYAVTVTATDAAGAAVTRGFTWTVSNGAPIAAPDTATTRAGTPVLVAVTANDIDPDGDAIRLVPGPDAASAAHGTVTADPATGLLTYMPDAGFSGTDTIVYTIVDAQGERATGILTVTVTPVNQRPVAPDTLPGRNGADGETVRVPLGSLITDPERGALAYTAAGLPPGLAVDPATGEIIGTIAPGASGPSGRTTYVVTLTATDPGGLAVSRSFAWSVTNPPPVAADDTIATNEDAPVDIDVTDNDSDPDGDPLAVVPGSMSAAHGSVTLNPDGSLRYQPAPDFNGTDTIVYTITDGNGGFATASVTVTVRPVNDAPTVDPGSPALVDRAANDAEIVSIPAGGAFGDIDAGDRLIFTATGLPPGLTVDPATGLISGTIASDASGRVPGGVYTITLTGTDTAGASATARFTITVGNPAPVAADDTGNIDEDGVLEGSVLGNDFDPDGDPIRVDPVPVAGPAHGRLDLRPDGTFTYTPDPDFHGEDSFTYAVIDSDGGRATATVYLTVASVNDAPEGHADPLVIPANTTGTGRIVASDRDGDSLGFRITGQPVNGTMVLNPDGTYSYRPYAAFSGSDSFTVEVSDGNGGTTLVTVGITIVPNPVFVPPGAPIPFPAPPAAPPVLPPESIVATGFILPAVAEIDSLGSIGDVVLADGAVVAAVNGVAYLGGTPIVIDDPVLLAESERIARLSWFRFEQEPIDDVPWFSPRPYLGRSLGFSLDTDAVGTDSHDLMVEAIRRPDILAINLRNTAPDTAAVAEVRLRAVDGAPAPRWIEGDGRGGFWGRPPAGTGIVALELEVVLEDGRTIRRPLTVDAETGEVRALPTKPAAARPSTPEPKRAPWRDPDTPPRTDAPLFTTQLASLDGRTARDLALIERALNAPH